MTHEVALTADGAADLLQIADWIVENDSAANALHVLERIEASSIASKAGRCWST